MTETTAYMRVVGTLEARRQNLTEPAALPDEHTLAAEFSVARGTIRQALRVLDERGAVTRRRRQGTFLQPPRARPESLRGKAVGIVPPWWAEKFDFGAWYNAVIYEGITRWTSERDCTFRVLHLDQHPPKESEWLNLIRNQKLAGIVWVHPQEGQLDLLRRTAKLFPTVVLGRTVSGPNLHHVVPDYNQAARLVDQHLMEHHCPMYSLVGKNITDPFHQGWISSFRQAQQRRGEEFNPIKLFFDTKCFREADHGKLLLDYYLPYVNQVRGLMFTSAGWLYSALQYEPFRQRMMTDLSVVTINFGSYPLESFWPGRVITHVHCDWAEMAFRAMETLALAAEGSPVPEVIQERVELIVGDTVHQHRPG